MGAAWDAMCENESLQSTLNKKNRQIREQKKLILELAEGIVKHFNDSVHSDYANSGLEEKAKNVLDKLNKKTKKKK